MCKQVKVGIGALVALAACASAQTPNVLVDLTATQFVSVLNNNQVVPAWQNNGTLGGEFRPVGNGSGTVFSSNVGGIPAVTLLSGQRNSNCVMTNMVSPNAVCGQNVWSFETWVYKEAFYAGTEIVFTWTGRNAGWGGNGANGSCWEFRYGSDAGNAIERYDGNNNLRWNAFGGGVPPVGSWHHVVATRDASGRERLYLDGSLRDSRNPMQSTIRSDVGYFTIGAHRNMDGSNWENVFSGSIALLRVYDGTLSTTDVVAKYQAGCLTYGLTPQTLLPTWIGTPGATEAWGAPAKWSSGRVPANGELVSIENKGTASGVPALSAIPNLIALDGGLEMTGGLLTVTNPPSGVSMAYGFKSTFDLNLTGGKLHIQGTTNPHLYLGRDLASTSGAVGSGYGRAIIGGGSELAWLCADGAIQVGKGATGLGFMEVRHNGLVTVSNNNFFVTAESATGTVTVAGGTIRCERNRVTLGNGGGSQAKLILNSGLVEMPGNLYMSENANANSLAEVYLNGGVLCLVRFEPNTTGKNYVYLNGGTIRNRDGNTRNDFMENKFTAVYVQSGGAVFDIIYSTAIGNTSVRVDQPLIADPNSPGGGLTKIGPGTLYLNAANTFTGDIIVDGGILIFNNANGLPSNYSGNILLRNGGAIGWNVAGGATKLMALIDPASVGSIILFDANRSESINLSGHPNLSIGSSSANQYTGTLTPYNGNQYKFFLAGGSVRYDPAITDPNASITLDSTPAVGYLDLYGNSTFTGGTTINNGVIVMYNVNALGQPPYPGARDIGIYNGAGLMLNISFSQQDVNNIIARIKLDSRGALLLGGNVVDRNYDLSAIPGLTLGANDSRDFNGVLTSHASIGGYHFGGGRQGPQTSGIQIKNRADLPGITPTALVAQYPGSVVLYENNTFTGGIIASNSASIWVRNDSALGALPPTPRADALYMNGAYLRPDMQVSQGATDPNRGLTVGPGGMMIYPPGNRFMAWRGDLHGTGAITNNDSGVIIFGGANNTWAGTLTLVNNNADGTFAIGYGQDFSWVKTNVIQGSSNPNYNYGGLFGVATDLDIIWSDKFARPLGNVPEPQYDAPDCTSANLGLRKLGAGTLTLDVPNTYRRDTRVDTGVLKIGTANAIPWGSGKGALNFAFQNGNFFPAGGILDINGFDVNVNGLIGGTGLITDSQNAGKALIFGNNNANYPNADNPGFMGTADPSVRLVKTGTGTHKFWKGANIPTLAVNQGTVAACPETTYGSVTMSNTAIFAVGLSATESYGLTGEYFFFDMVGFQAAVCNANMLRDADTFDTVLAPYKPYHVQSSFSFGATFDAGWTGTGSPGSKFQTGNGYEFRNRNYHYGRWTGEFYAETEGDYIFSIASDDGGAVFIDRQIAVTNLTTLAWGSSYRNGQPLHLTQGWHDIIIAHQQGTGDRGLTVYLTPPGVALPPPGSERPAILPQALLRPYLVNVGSFSGTLGTRMEVRSNQTLRVTGETSGVFNGQLLALDPAARLIKDGPGAQTIASQTIPSFTGQVTVANGTLALSGGTPFTRPVRIEAGATLAAVPQYPGWDRGLKGVYAAGNFNDGNASASIAGLDNWFNQRATTYVANTTQAGAAAVLNGWTNFSYADGSQFPGPYNGSATEFNVRFTGKFLALEPGTYTFGVSSDDRADVLLDGVRIIENSTSGTGWKYATAALAAGTHDLQIPLGQGGGAYRIQMQVAAPGGTTNLMPNALLRPNVATVVGWEGDGLLALPDPGSYLRVDLSTPHTLNSGLPGAPGSEFEKNGPATLTLARDNDDFYGTWYVMQGTMMVGNGDIFGSLGNAARVHVATGSRLVFNRPDDITFDGQVSGGGEICSIGGGRVTFSNIGSDFKGAFTSGAFTVILSGTQTDVQAANLNWAQGADLRVIFTDGATLRLPTPTDPPLPLPPLVFSNATVRLPTATTNVHYTIPSLMIEAGTTLQCAAFAPGNGLPGRYYALNPSYVQNDVTAAFAALATGEAYLEQFPIICIVSTGEAGANMDFAENGSLFPQGVLTNRTTNFAALYKGKIRIETPGEYRFRTRSDDHSMVFINGDVAMNNNYNQGMTDRPGNVVPVTLTAGLHDIAILYAQGGGGYGLRVYVTLPGPGMSEQLLPNSMLLSDAYENVMPFTLEVGTLGVVNGPGVGTVLINGGSTAAGDTVLNGTLLLNNLYIESAGAVLAAIGNTQLAGNNLHVAMGREPPFNSRNLVGDFTQTPAWAQLLSGKTTSLSGATNSRLDYRTGYLYVVRPGGTVLILR